MQKLNAGKKLQKSVDCGRSAQSFQLRRVIIKNGAVAKSPECFERLHSILQGSGGSQEETLSSQRARSQLSIVEFNLDDEEMTRHERRSRSRVSRNHAEEVFAWDQDSSNLSLASSGHQAPKPESSESPATFLDLQMKHQNKREAKRLRRRENLAKRPSNFEELRLAFAGTKLSQRSEEDVNEEQLLLDDVSPRDTPDRRVKLSEDVSLV